jgi:hypothetical protein
MWLDELFWELLCMEENKKEPVSLRAIGAYTVGGASIYEKETILSSWTEEELRGLDINDAIREYVNGEMKGSRL